MSDMNELPRFVDEITGDVYDFDAVHGFVHWLPTDGSVQGFSCGMIPHFSRRYQLHDEMVSTLEDALVAMKSISEAAKEFALAVGLPEKVETLTIPENNLITDMLKRARKYA